MPSPSGKHNKRKAEAGLGISHFAMSKMEQPADAKTSNLFQRDCPILIMTVERENPDGIIATSSDGTTAAFLVEELLQPRPRREPTEFAND